MPLQVSKRSWHYKLYRYVKSIPDTEGPRELIPFTGVARKEYDVPKSLCPYAWSILLGLLGGAAVLVLLAAFSIVYGLIAGTIAAYKATDRQLETVDRWVFGFKHAERKKREKQERRNRPSLALAFVRARKDRVCPPLELVD